MSISKLLLKRGVALWIDLLISTLICMLWYERLSTIYVMDEFPFVITLGLILMVGRDIFGRSLGKCIMGLKIIDINTNLPARLYKRIVRNFTFPITVVEAIVLLSQNNNSRFGDTLSGTRVESIK